MADLGKILGRALSVGIKHWSKEIVQSPLQGIKMTILSSFLWAKGHNRCPSFQPVTLCSQIYLHVQKLWIRGNTKNSIEEILHRMKSSLLEVQEVLLKGFLLLLIINFILGIHFIGCYTPVVNTGSRKRKCNGDPWILLFYIRWAEL